MKFEDTKHECPDFIKREQDQSLYVNKWIACENGYRHRSGRIHNGMSFYVCKLKNLMCPHHWIKK